MQPLATIAVFFSGLAVASAASISVNFNSDRDAAAELGAAEMAGAPGFVVSGWNNFNGLESSPATSPITGTTADVASPNMGVLSDDSGAAVGTTISWTGNNSWNTNNGTASSDNKLMNGYLDNNATNGASISITGVPYALYTVVGYFGSDGNGRSGTIGISGGPTYSYSTNSNLGGAFPGSYVQTTDTGAGNPSSNFAVFENQTAADFTLAITRGDNNSGFHGFSIIETIPEPSLTALLSLAGLGLIFRRRR